MHKLFYKEVVEKCKSMHGDRYVYPSDIRLWHQRGVYYGATFHVRTSYRHSIPPERTTNTLASHRNSTSDTIPIYI